MRIVTDTNVLISATFWYGDSFEIVRRVENGEITLILSKAIIDEYAKVLQSPEIARKIGRKDLQIRQSVQKIVSLSTIVKPQQTLIVIVEDPDDNRILECAQEGDADYIITKDNHILRLSHFGNVTIMTPHDFLSHRI